MPATNEFVLEARKGWAEMNSNLQIPMYRHKELTPKAKEIAARYSDNELRDYITRLLKISNNRFCKKKFYFKDLAFECQMELINRLYEKPLYGQGF